MATGAMSYAFITALNEQPDRATLTWAQLITNMRNILHHGSHTFTQMPQLSMGKPLDPGAVAVSF
jgi:hypothetical protein